MSSSVEFPRGKHTTQYRCLQGSVSDKDIQYKMETIVPKTVLYSLKHEKLDSNECYPTEAVIEKAKTRRTSFSSVIHGSFLCDSKGVSSLGSIGSNSVSRCGSSRTMSRLCDDRVVVDD